MSVRIHIVLDDDLAARLKALAKTEDRAVSRQIAFMLRKSLDAMVNRDGTPYWESTPSADPEERAAEMWREDLEPPPPDPEPGQPWYEPQ